MNELIILAAFIPVALLSVFKSARLKTLVAWFAAAVALLVNGYFIYLHFQEPLLWFPVAVLYVSSGLDAALNRKFHVLTALGMTFVAQALLTQDIALIIILVAFADAFLCAELFFSSQLEQKSKAVRGIYRSALSLLPATLGLLLHLEGDGLVVAVTLTMVMRLFSWPVTHWISDVEKNDELFLLFVGAATSFAFWHVQDLSHQPAWSMVWLIIAAVFSLGAQYNEVYCALCFGIYAAHPPLGLLFVSGWPLLLQKGKTIYLVAALALVAGAAIANDATQSIVENVAFVVSVLSAFGLARVFVAATPRPLSWYSELSRGVCAVGLGALAVFLIPLEIPQPNSVALVFGGSFIFFYAVGKIIFLKRQNPFLPMKALPAHIFLKDYISFEVLVEKPGRPIQISEGNIRKKFFNLLEGEGHLVFLFGVLGLILIWGMK